MMTPDCYACRLVAGAEELPGGRIHATRYWVVEHCTGPLGVGTLIVKPFRHCIHVGELSTAEAREMGPLLQRISAAVKAFAHADQVYVCLWSHQAWQPAHIHFVVQPAWNGWSDSFSRPGPFVQAAMFKDGERPPISAIEQACDQIRTLLQHPA